MPARRLAKQRVDVHLTESACPALLTPILAAFDTPPEGEDPLDRHQEMFGLLWGHIQYDPEMDNPRVIISQVTVDARASMSGNGLTPSNRFLTRSTDLIQRFWPELTLVGTFHALPDEKVAEAGGGYHAALSEPGFYPRVHSWYQPLFPTMAHLIITIASSGIPHLHPSSSGKRSHGGYQLSIDNKKLWMRCYSTQQIQPGIKPVTRMANLRAAALAERFQEDQ
ncbi:hypothetical protein LIN78_03675 [Leeia sp. TBRC 13508]|uniref:Uncharacterized protein n=1 Tax=Leeia speluncae TaxID=2884804 RepID=A0ABS8D3T0_9NEIS|nr:hypothetical protein [Leeia speluncae]MCB6182651.1 hypothetical protein [Leeia speluncae]